jgi:UDP-2-acetamido-3-amino-2,3-dideoxy-glucuronate N-acetyltransferase
MAYSIHKLSDVQTTKIGDDTVIWQYTVVLEGATIGKNCNINCLCFIENDVILGDNVTIKSGVQLWDGLQIGDNVFIGPNVTFTNDLVPRSKFHNKAFEQTIIENGCSIGANCTIIGGIILGEKSFIGAGSVLTKSTPPYSVWYGNPAIQKGYITHDLIILDMELINVKNGEKYFLDGFKPVKYD